MSPFALVKRLTKSIPFRRVKLRPDKLLQAFMDSSIDYIYFKDLESRFIKVNKAWAKTWGAKADCDAEKIVGKSDFDFFTREFATEKFRDEQNIIRTGQPLFGKEEISSPNGGRSAWVYTIKMPLRDQDGKIIGTFGITRDVTEIKRAQDELENYKAHLEEIIKQRTAELEHDILQRKLVEEKLRDSEEYLEITLASIGDAVIATDSEGCITRMNSQAEKLTGFSAATAEKQALTDVFRIINGKTRRPLDSPFDLIKGGLTIKSFPPDATLINQAGRECAIAGNAARIKATNGEMLGVVIVFRDISEQRFMEMQLRQAERMQAIGQLAGGVAHDFNNQITGIMGCAEMLKILVKDEDLLRYVNMLMTAAGARFRSHRQTAGLRPPRHLSGSAGRCT